MEKFKSRNPYDIDSEGHKLHNLFFEVTSRCNAFCDHCGSRCDSSKREEISADEFKKVLFDVARNFGTDQIMLNITGGEPLVRKDVFDIAKCADDLGFSWGLVTNGMLITDEVIEKMKQTHMSTISISLDGMKKTHEEFRHVKGCFDKIVLAVQKLKKEKFVEHIQITFVATKNNISELPELYRLLDMLDVDSLRISSIDKIGRAKDNENLMLDKKDFLYLFNFIKKHRNSKLLVLWSCTHYFGNTKETLDPIYRKFACFTGIHSASVLSNGDIFGCPNIPRRKELIQGNVLKDNFSYVWENKFKVYRERDRTKGKKCNDCKNYDFCRGDSFHTYDFDNDEPLFCYKEMFEQDIKISEEKPISFQDLLSKISEKYDSKKLLLIKPKISSEINVIFTSEATYDLKGIFHYGKNHPSNLYEQQAALIGNKVGNTYLIKYVVSSILINRAENMAITDDFCLNQVLDEVDIINENISRADEIYKDEFDRVCLLGFAHSHPLDTEFRFSINDTKNHLDYVKLFGEFISVILNPQKEYIVCFEGEECLQTNLYLLSK